MKGLGLALLSALWGAGATAGEPPTFRVESLPTHLTGEWLWRAGHDPAWSSPFRERHAWQPLRVPGCWQRTGAPGVRGHAWYVTRLFIPSQLADQELALDLGVVADGAEIFLNGRRIGGHGGFPPRFGLSVAVPHFYRLPRVSLRYGEVNELAVHVYSIAGCSGLLGPGPRIDGYSRLLSAYVRRDLGLTAVATFLVTLAVLHLVLFGVQRSEIAQLSPAAFFALAAVFFLTQTSWGPTQLLTEGVVYRLHLAALLGGGGVAITLLYQFLQTPVPIPLVTLQAAVVLGIGFVAAWPATADLAIFPPLAKITILLLGPYLLSQLLGAARRRRPHARTALAVTVLLGCTAVTDIATQVGLLPRQPGFLAQNTSLASILPFAMTFTVIFFQRWARRRWGEGAEANGDPLTAERFLRRLEREMERARRHGSPLSVALLRLTAAPSAGPMEHLRELAHHALRRTLRLADALAVVRPDTFAVLLEDTDERAAIFLVERLRLVILEALPRTQPGAAVAAGVAEFRRDRHQRSGDFMAELQAALYAAVAEGDNTTATPH